MSAMDYSGPERRRGGPDRRNVGEVDANPHRRRPRPVPRGDREHPRARARLRDRRRGGRFAERDRSGHRDVARRHPDGPVAAVTGRDRDDPADQARAAVDVDHRPRRQTRTRTPLFDAIKAGAAAFILKDVGPDDLVTIIRRVVAGEYLINDKVFAKPAVASRVLKEFRELAVYGQEAAPIFAPLSPREVEILDNIAQGMTNKQVAYALSI